VSTRPRRIRIGEMLLAAGELSQQQLDEALAVQRESGRRLGRVLVEQGYIDEDRLLSLLGRQIGVDVVDLATYTFQPGLVRRLPETQARRHRAIVLDERDGEAVVAMADPMDLIAWDEICAQLAQPVRAVLVREADLLVALDGVYRRTDEISSFAEQLEQDLGVDRFDLSLLSASADDGESPVARLLQSIMEDAVQVRASDVHIEPDEHVLRIRLRVDGLLQETLVKESRIATALVSRLKLMAGLDIAEKRLPQDGRFRISVKGRDIDVRMNTMPVRHGESAVMRLLDQQGGVRTLDAVGMPAPLLDRFRRLVHRPTGLVLVTGPTGSGKTTTLYGAIGELNAAERKIITIEDPVEYALPRVSQVQVNPKIGLTFATVLRATLRQDPDVLLVGEIRDRETAEIALRAAMTGHLVLSTLHTNDAVATAMRLLDIGIEGYLAATALRGIVAQRLVRRLCESCARPSALGAQRRAFVRSLAPAAEAMAFLDAPGCTRCGGTGYRGRVGVFELLEMGGELADALRAGDAVAFARHAAAQPGYRSLLLHALDYAAAGTTSVGEVMRLAGEVELPAADAPPMTPSAAPRPVAVH
jgi:MSHA biogenesis protein MshE